MVAEMKKTSRARDWDAASALGTKLLKAGDSRGWLHLFDSKLLTSMIQDLHCPAAIVSQRPVLSLAISGDPRLRPAMWAEQLFGRRGRCRCLILAAGPTATVHRKDCDLSQRNPQNGYEA